MSARAVLHAGGFFCFAVVFEWAIGHQTNWGELANCCIGLFFGYCAGWRGRRAA